MRRLAAPVLALALLAVAGACPADAGTSSLRPVADSAVSASAPGRAAGRAHVLRVGPARRDRAYLRFALPALDGPVRTVTLRLRSTAARRSGLEVYALSSGAKWSERGLRYRNAPRGGRLVARTKRVARGRVDVQLKVAALKLASGGRLNLAIAARGGKALAFSSREVRSGAPQLVVTTAGTVTIAAAGDIACPPGAVIDAFHCQQQATSDLVVAGGYDRVLALGDNQYNSGSLSEFQASYGPTWGRVRGNTSPVVGNHEYSATYPPPAGSKADGYFDYFDGVGKQDGRAGRRGQGWYSYDLGAWHLIALNSICALLPRGTAADGCAAGSPQERWLQADLRAHRDRCTLAYWHYPRFSSGNAPDSNHVELTPLWNDLMAARVELVLSGHQHGYERFAPMDGAGNLVADGIREFVVGTGGEDFHGFNPPEAGSEVINADTFGVLRLTLRTTGYDWQFVPIAGATFTDSGSADCH
jgi:Calcineurin-like phosphoesterase